ncbi:hypothetical protein [Streptomyces sp. NPDC003032]
MAVSTVLYGPYAIPPYGDEGKPWLALSVAALPVPGLRPRSGPKTKRTWN